MNIFSQEYAGLYDLVHKDKNYFSETTQLIELIHKKGLMKNSKILDFGCGTGRHLNELSERGFESLTGYDINPNMLEIARKFGKKFSFFSDIENVPINHDLAFSLFDVLSYQNSISDAKNFVFQIVSKCKPQSYIVLDGWHLPGVLRYPPENRLKKIVTSENTLLRKVTVLESTIENVTNLKIEILEEGQNEIILTELHKMRAFTQQEIEMVVKSCGGTEILFMDGSDYNLPLRQDSWRFAVIFKKDV